MRLVADGATYYYRKCELWRSSGHVNGDSAGTSLDYLIFSRLNHIECKNINTVELAQQIEDKKRDAIFLGMGKLLSTTKELGTINPAFHPYYERYMNDDTVEQNNGCYENDHEKYIAALQERVRLQEKKDKEYDEEEKVSTPNQV